MERLSGDIWHRSSSRKVLQSALYLRLYLGILSLYNLLKEGEPAGKPSGPAALSAYGVHPGRSKVGARALL